MALNGKIALITGCVKNLGAAIAEELVSAGANLALHYNSTSSKDNASQLEASLKRKNPGLKIAFYQGDLTTAAAVKHLFQFVLMDFGKIDVIVNTAGKVLKKPLLRYRRRNMTPCSRMCQHLLARERTVLIIDTAE